MEGWLDPVLKFFWWWLTQRCVFLVALSDLPIFFWDSWIGSSSLPSMTSWSHGQTMGGLIKKNMGYLFFFFGTGCLLFQKIGRIGFSWFFHSRHSMWLESPLLYINFGLFLFFAPYMSSAETCRNNPLFVFLRLQITKVKLYQKGHTQKGHFLLTTVYKKKSTSFSNKPHTCHSWPAPFRFVFSSYKIALERKQKCSCGSSRSTRGRRRRLGWKLELRGGTYALELINPCNLEWVLSIYVFITWLVVASM